MEEALPNTVGMESPGSMSSSAAAAASKAAAEVVEKDYAGLGGFQEEAEEFEEEENAEEQEEEEEELELGLTLGKKKVVSGGAAATPWLAQRCRILTAKDFPSLLSRASPRSSSASSVSSSSGNNMSGGGVAGTKRAAADSVSPDHARGSPHPPSQVVVGWPPIRAFRMNSLFNHAKDSISEAGETTALKKANHHGISNDDNQNNSLNAGNGSKDQERRGRATRNSRFVKVNMDGDPIGRKVDLSVHHSYEALAITLELMFHKLAMAVSASSHGTKNPKLLDGSSEFALTYEDKDGDWMLVGDVPWGMFLATVKRLRIMRTTEANGLRPGFQTSSTTTGLLRSKPS